MKLTAALTVLLGTLGVTIAFSQASDPSVNKQPPNVQAPRTPKKQRCWRPARCPRRHVAARAVEVAGVAAAAPLNQPEPETTP